MGINESKYYNMTKFQKSAAERKFFTAAVKADEVPRENGSMCNDQALLSNKLSVSPEESRIAHIPFHSVCDMFEKAGNILSAEGEIVKAPTSSQNSSYYVASTSNPETPHSVRIIGNNSQFACDKNCVRWLTYKICSHVLAVADKVGDLKKFLTWFCKAQRAPNLTALSNAHLPSNRGKKATKSTQKRKGGDPNKPRSEVLGYIERPTAGSSIASIKPALPDPASGTYIVTLLKYCHEKTSICFV
ncbi:MAG: hypothetical protein ABW185_02230 [Sedimenticola sp.]